jgi:hypothetical protein
MATNHPDTPSRSPSAPSSSIHYVGRKEPRIPVPVLLVGLAAVAAAVIAFLHFART